MGGQGNGRAREWEGKGMGGQGNERAREWEGKGMGGQGNGRAREWEGKGMGESVYADYAGEQPLIPVSARWLRSAREDHFHGVPNGPKTTTYTF